MTPPQHTSDLSSRVVLSRSPDPASAMGVVGPAGDISRSASGQPAHGCALPLSSESRQDVGVVVARPAWQPVVGSGADGQLQPRVIQPAPQPLARAVRAQHKRADGTPDGTVILSWAKSQATAASRANSECVAVPPAGAGKSGCRRRQFATAARPTPAIRPIVAISIVSRPSAVGG